MKIKLLVLACFLFLLISCVSRTDGWEINVASEVCKDHGGINYINHISGDVICNDGFYKQIAFRR